MTTTTVTCEARTGFIPGTFGLVPRLCGQSRYLRRWVDRNGTQHASCPRHLAAMTHRWPVGDVAPEAARERVLV